MPETDVPRILTRLQRRWSGYWPQADVARIADDVVARFRDACTAWDLDGARPLPDGEVALACTAVRETRPVVLKVVPRGTGHDDALRGESAALAFWQSTGIVPELLDRRDDGLTFLMERVLPGEPLDRTETGPDERLTLLGRLAAALHSAGPAPEAIMHLHDAAVFWRRHLASRPEDLEELESLLIPAPGDVLVHGDLHGLNVLRGDGVWKVIDPHANRGDRHADIWALMDPSTPELPDDVDEATTEVWRRIEVYAAAADLGTRRAADWVRLRARAEALEIEAQPETADLDDLAWAAQMHQIADVLRRRP